VNDLMRKHDLRVAEMRAWPEEALGSFWYPFAQHAAIEEDGVSLVDSREGNYLSTFDKISGNVSQTFDSCASWWTQGPDLSMQLEMGRKLGHAASRYGHVIFPTNAHKPVLDCTRHLLSGPGQGWAKRVFYSDNGSTAIEVALKMAFRKYLSDAAARMGKSFFKFEDEGEEAFGEIKVVTQRGAYHGDTLACMNATEKSVFNGWAQFPWNKEACVVVEPAYLQQKDGAWVVKLPHPSDEELNYGSKMPCSLSAFFDDCKQVLLRRDAEALEVLYWDAIDMALGPHKSLGALLIEPVCQGAGGMKFIDPLWQRTLIRYCREVKQIPVIFDEIFVGLYRCGAESVRDLLGVDPDIACYGKLLTGGQVPLGVTLATEEIFECFLDNNQDGKGKQRALLHGHSYTAYPLGCSAANFAFEKYNALLKRECGQAKWKANYNSTSSGKLVHCFDRYWDEGSVRQISQYGSVESAVALGTVLSVELAVAAGEAAGYTNTAGTERLIRSLARKGVYCRPLGNVLYFMCSPFTSKEECDGLLEKLHEVMNLT